MSFRKEPDYTHGSLSRTAVVLINLGTPDEPTPVAVKRYLKEFLSDSRVVEIPKAIWWFILNGIILPIRSRKSAEKYASIWTNEGSPLKKYTEKQALLLQGYLGERGHGVRVVYAMRYGNPSIPDILETLKKEGCDRVLILPAYPQYSGTTTASLYDAVFAHYQDTRNLPELRFIKHYHDDPGYIQALARSVSAYWQQNGRPDRLVMSFHGVPKRTLLLGDPYHCECHKTARLLATALGLSPDDYLVTFQSRFGRAEWLQPYTAPTVQKLAKDGTARIDVMCPGFTSDCLETLEEIAMEVRHDFLTSGGKEFHYIPCLNDAPDWIHGMAALVETHLGGWPTQNDAATRQRCEEEAGVSAAQAKRLGAVQ